MKKYTILLLGLVLVSSGNAERINLGTISTTFGKTGIGGNQYTDSPLGNPAGLCKIEGGNLYYSSAVRSFNRFGGGGAIVLKDSPFYFSAVFDNYHNYSTDSFQLIQNIISIAIKLNSNLIIGCSGKEIVINNNSSQYLDLGELDAGLIAILTKNLEWGITWYSKAENGNFYLPQEAGTGILYKFSKVNFSSDIVWVGEGNIPAYPDKHILIGMGVSSFGENGPFWLIHGGGVYTRFNYEKKEIEYPHLTVSLTPSSFPVSTIFDISKNFFAIQVLLGMHYK